MARDRVRGQRVLPDASRPRKSYVLVLRNASHPRCLLAKQNARAFASCSTVESCRSDFLCIHSLAKTEEESETGQSAQEREKGEQERARERREKEQRARQRESETENLWQGRIHCFSCIRSPCVHTRFVHKGNA